MQDTTKSEKVIINFRFKNPQIILKLTLLFLIGSCVQKNNSNVQTIENDTIVDMKMSVEEYEKIKQVIKEDVVNWCNKPKIISDEIIWKMMVVKDTAIPIIIETDTGNFQIDVVEEVKRRLIGGFAGSYPHVESWSFDISESELIEIIEKIKIENNLQVPNSKLTLGRSSYWYFIDFYDKSKNEIISIWTRENSPESTTLALFSYRPYQNIVQDDEVERKLINRDFWKVENDDRIKNFEKMIIEKIKLKQK